MIFRRKIIDVKMLCVDHAFIHIIFFLEYFFPESNLDFRALDKTDRDNGVVVHVVQNCFQIFLTVLVTNPVSFATVLNATSKCSPVS